MKSKKGIIQVLMEEGQVVSPEVSKELDPEKFKDLMEQLFSSGSEPRFFQATQEACAKMFDCEKEQVLEVAYQAGYNITYIGGGWFSFVPSEE